MKGCQMGEKCSPPDQWGFFLLFVTLAVEPTGTGEKCWESVRGKCCPQRLTFHLHRRSISSSWDQSIFVI